MNVPHDALFQKCINGSAPSDRRVARAPDKKSFKQHFLLNHWSNSNIFRRFVPHNTLYQNCTMVTLCSTKAQPELQIRNIFEQHFLLNHWSKFKTISIVPLDTFYQNCTNGSAPLNIRAARAPGKKYLEKAFPLKPLVKIQIISQKCSSWCHLPNCTNSSAPPNKGAARALDKKCLLKTFTSETKVQIQNNFTELLLIMHSSKISQMVPLHWSVIFRWATQGPRALLFSLLG